MSRTIRKQPARWGHYNRGRNPNKVSKKYQSYWCCWYCEEWNGKYPHSDKRRMANTIEEQLDGTNENYMG